jgi:hypothetical protein
MYVGDPVLSCQSCLKLSLVSADSSRPEPERRDRDLLKVGRQAGKAKPVERRFDFGCSFNVTFCETVDERFDGTGPVPSTAAAPLLILPGAVVGFWVDHQFDAAVGVAGGALRVAWAVAGHRHREHLVLG